MRNSKISTQIENAIEQTIREAFQEKRIIFNPTSELLKELTSKEQGIRISKYNHIVTTSEPTSRAAKHTKNNIDNRFGQKEIRLLEQMISCLSKERLISTDYIVGNTTDNITARLIVPERYAHIAYGGTKLFPQNYCIQNPTHQVIMFFDENFETNKSKPLPKKDITIRLVHKPDGKTIKVVRNSNYFGEFKKGVFAGEDWRVKQKKDGIFLHAGCRQDYLEMAHGGYERQNSLFVALSANGKTSTTCKVLARKGREESWLIQDDGGTLTKEGSFKGFEAGGIFVKTEGITPGDQREIYYGVLKPDSYLENICLNKNNEFDFYDANTTSNGRAVIRRQDFMHAHPEIDVEKINNLFIITRGPTIPAIAKLNPEQATAFMVLGQAEESSAGDPTQAGQIKNEFFYDPFMAGNKVNHANLFYEILKSNQIECYLLNTGGIGSGETYHDIKLEDTMGILDSVLRGGLENWVESEGIGLEVPISIRTVDSILLHPKKLFNGKEFEKRESILEEQRKKTIEQYPSLDERIRSVFIK